MSNGAPAPQLRDVLSLSCAHCRYLALSTSGSLLVSRQSLLARNRMSSEPVMENVVLVSFYCTRTTSIQSYINHIMHSNGISLQEMGLRLHILQVIKWKYQFLWAPMTCFAAAEVVLGHWGKFSSCTRLMFFPTVVLFWTCLKYLKVYSGKVVSQWASRWIARPKVQIIRNIYNDSTSFLCLVLLSVLPA